MGKIVKYCAACEEGFAEKFGFCPNCGAQLTAFELNPVENQKKAEPKPEPIEAVEAAPPTVNETPAVIEAPAIIEAPLVENASPVAETRAFSAVEPTIEPAETKEFFEFGNEVFEEPVEETKTFEPAETSSNANVNDDLYEATYTRSADESPKVSAPHYAPNYDYQPTIVYEKNVKQRNTLLLGVLILGCTFMVGGYVYSMFNKFLDLAAIDSPDLLAYVGEVDPTQMDLEEQPEKKEDKGGGGGGGGKDEENPTSKGREAAQVDNPMFAPSYKYDKVTNPDIAIQAATKNKNERDAEKTDEYYGLKNGGNVLSDGDGTGGGQGSGKGRGQGGGEGGGIGNGIGDGRGDGRGDGEGDGEGGGINTPTVKVKPPTPVGPTEGVKILSKPKALYTDAARQNQVQGKVTLRVTFSANGSIGGISVISGLGNGLTEQAIAAARGIKFEPAKRGGVPYSVTKPVEYSFTIY